MEEKKRKNTEGTITNFEKLENRIMGVNDPNNSNVDFIRQMLCEISIEEKPTLIIATGGSKVVANYLSLILDRINSGIINEVIEPRDYIYKNNRNKFSNLIVVSASGNTNGISYALNDFRGKKYLLCENKKDEYNSVAWANQLYSHEKSFISLASSLCPMTLLLDSTESLNTSISSTQLRKINDKIKYLIDKSREKVDKIDHDFKKCNTLEVLSGNDTKTSSSIIESNLIEAGIMGCIIHDKGSFCHGRSNLMFNYDNPVIYLLHKKNELDDILLNLLNKEYNNVTLCDTLDLDDTIFYKEYYLALQMYYLSRKIAESKNIDLTMPEYNRNIVKTLYKYRGEM